MAKKEPFKYAGYCHADVIEHYKKMKRSGCTHTTMLIRLIAKVAAAHLEMHTQVYLTTHGRNNVAVIPFTAYEFHKSWGRDPSEFISYFKMGEVIHDIFGYFKKSRRCGFVLTSEYVGVIV